MLLGMRSTLLSSVAFSPASLFAAGEQGVWYDPSDMTTLFTTSAGTTPVTAVETAVGLMLDKSQNGVGTNGAKRVNLLTWTEAFNDAYWNKVRLDTTGMSNVAVAPDGTTTADRLRPNTTSGLHYADNGVIPATTLPAAVCRISVYAKPDGYNFLAIGEAGGTAWAYFDVSSGTVGNTNGSPTTAIESVGNGWYRCTVQFTSSGGVKGAFFLVDQVNGSLSSWSGNGTSGIFIWGADLRLASEAATTPTYQPITSSWAATIPGNHATQSIDAARPVLSARVNLLTKTEQFNDAVWTKGGTNPSTVTANTTVAPDGTTTADTITTNSVPTGEIVYQTVSAPLTALRFIQQFKRGNHDWVRITVTDASTRANGFGAWFNLATGAVGSSQASGTGTLTSKSITSLGDGWYLCEVIGSLTDSSLWVLNASADADNSFTRVANGTRIVWGADLRVANDTALPVYQRVNTSTDYDTTGFPMYLRFDGNDDRMNVSGPAMLRNVNGAFVTGGVRYLGTSSGYFTIFEADIATSASDRVGFYIKSPSAFEVGGRRLDADAYQGREVTGIPTLTNVLSGVFDYQNAQLSARVNGVDYPRSGGFQTAGNTSNTDSQAITIGSAASGVASLLHGRIYSLIVRGAATSAADITATETWVNGKTKAY